MGKLKNLVGSNLRSLREAKGKTREEMAEGIGTTATNLYRIESGTQWAAPELLDRALTYLDADPSHLTVSSIAEVPSTFRMPTAEEITGLVVKKMGIEPAREELIQFILSAEPAAISTMRKQLAAFGPVKRTRKQSSAS